MKRIDSISIFPDMFAALTESGISRRALEEKHWAWQNWNPRDFADNVWGNVDDRPYGGGPGMVMQAAPLQAAILAAKASQAVAGHRSHVIYLSPQGTPLTHRRVMELSENNNTALVLLCGRYEGIDERLISRCVDEEISIGDFVLSGGELAAMVLMDAIIRQLPEVLHDPNSAVEDSFATGLLDCPHYTRPPVYEDEPVPAVLLSGDHQKIRRWRLQQSLLRTRSRRPELLAHRRLTVEESQLLTAV